VENPSQVKIKTEDPSSKSGGGGSDCSTDPQLHKMKKVKQKEEDAKCSRGREETKLFPHIS
jgi:hypothetical protein